MGATMTDYERPRRLDVPAVAAAVRAQGRRGKKHGYDRGEQAEE
jgi:hypothetical protein